MEKDKYLGFFDVVGFGFWFAFFLLVDFFLSEEKTEEL